MKLRYGLFLFGLTVGASASADPISAVLLRIQRELVDTGKAEVPALESLTPADGKLAIRADSPCVQSAASIPVSALDWRDGRMNSSPNKEWYVEVHCKDFDMCIEAEMQPAPNAPADCPEASTMQWTIGVSRLNLIETDSKTARLVLDWLSQVE